MRRRAGRAGNMAYGKYSHRRQNAAFILLRLFGSLREAFGNGRSDPACLYPWLSRQRDRYPDYYYGIYVKREYIGDTKSFGIKRAACRKRMDVDHRDKRHAVFAYALAVFDDPSDNQKGNREPEMDANVGVCADCHGDRGLFCVYDADEDYTIVAVIGAKDYFDKR